MLLQFIVLCFNLVFFGRKLYVSDRNSNWPSMHGEKMVHLPSRLKQLVLNEKVLIKRLVLTHHPKAVLVSKLGQ